MDPLDSAAMMFMALCKQGRAEEAMRLAGEADFPDLIVGLSRLADACAHDELGELDRSFIMRMEAFLLDTFHASFGPTEKG